MYDDLPDARLVEMAQADPDSAEGRPAVEALLERYQDRVYTWCYRHVGEAERARDMAQEVMLSAYRNLGRFAGRSPFSTWLFAIARNRCISELRRPSVISDDEIDLDRFPSRQENPEEDCIERMSKEAIRTLLKKHLTPLEQEVLWLRCFERFQVEAIGTMLGITQASGARGVLQSARRKLRPILIRRGWAAQEE